MNCKWMGAILIIIGCGGSGMRIAAQHCREENTLRQLIAALDLMECELQYHLTPLPELCRMAGSESRGYVRDVLLSLASELEAQIGPDVESCMQAALSKTPDMPGKSAQALSSLGATLGRFDLTGQLKGLEAVRADCRRELEVLTADRDTRLRSYQTLGFCAGAAVAILFI